MKHDVNNFKTLTTKNREEVRERKRDVDAFFMTFKALITNQKLIP